MSGDTTQPTREPGETGAAPPAREVPALVVAYCREEPWRVGEVIFFPDANIETVLGRGPGDGREVRADLYRQRPSGTVKQPPLADRSLSRRQLLILSKQVGFDEVLDVKLLKNPDRPREMRVNGETRDRSDVRPGDTIEIRGEREGKLLLYCT